jgi:putative membrane protein insertion efficiency factor
MRRLLLSLLRGYQRYISRWFPPVCRFHPSCSNYAIEAIQTRPLPKALVMIAWRIVRCNPLSPGGYDPVNPEPGTSSLFPTEAKGK